MSGSLRNRLLVGDAAAELARLPGGSVDMVLTSPPYFRLRDYGVAGQLGLEDHVDAWVAALRTVAEQIGRVLTPTGTCWLNLGDSYATHLAQGAARKSLLLAPERLALALVADGWLLRNKVIWQKANPVPTSVRDRYATTYELVYVFARGPRYFFDLDAIRRPHSSRAGRQRRELPERVREPWRGPNGDDTSGLARLKAAGRVGHPLGKNPGDVLRLASSSSRSGHHATFPLTLATELIRAGCPERRCVACRTPWFRPLHRLGGSARRGRLQFGCACPPGTPSEPGLVLDPFIGSGTTAVAAAELGRDWLGVELNPAFAEQAMARVRSEQGRERAA